jgi:hypothetical protein
MNFGKKDYRKRVEVHFITQTHNMRGTEVACSANYAFGEKGITRTEVQKDKITFEQSEDHSLDVTEENRIEKLDV